MVVTEQGRKQLSLENIQSFIMYPLASEGDKGLDAEIYTLWQYVSTVKGAKQIIRKRMRRITPSVIKDRKKKSLFCFRTHID